MADHKYFKDEYQNDSVDMLREALRKLSAEGVFQASIDYMIAATESQKILREKSPKLWEEFDRMIMDPNWKR